MADWSMLPCDLLGDIALRLDNSVEHFIFFATVCRSWHRAHAMVKRRWIASEAIPWLLLAESTEDNPNHYRNLFCPINQRCYQLKLPESFGARCWGSTSGWIVTFDLNLEFHFFNPFTRVRIPLPPPSTMPHYEGFEGCDPCKLRQAYVDKMLVFGDNHDCIVMAFYGSHGDIAYVRPGDQAWKPLLTSELFSAIERKAFRASPHDAVQLGSQFFFMFHNGALGYCNLSDLQGHQPVMVSKYLPPPLEILEELHQGLYRIYLLNSFGDLLMVLRYKEEVQNEVDSVNYETLGFEVYKLNFGSNTWEEVKDLGNVALFVGNNNSISVQASCSDNCKRNCIYFTDDEWQFWASPKLFGGHDIGVFNMENKNNEKVYEGDVHSSFCPPLWFMPKFF